MKKRRTNARQAGQSVARLNSMPWASTFGPQARSVGHRLIYVASAFFLLQSMGAWGFIDRVIYGDRGPIGGDKITLTFNLLNIIVSIFLFWSGVRETRIARFNRALPLAAASLLLISALWSPDPRVTLTQGTAYFCVVLGAIGMVEALDTDVLMELAALISGLCAIASLVQFFIVREPLGDFRGIFQHKNLLGQVMAVGVLLALHGLRNRSGQRCRYICIIALCTIVAFMSKSATAILVIAVFFGLDILGRVFLRGGAAISILLLVGFSPIVIYFVMNMDLIFDVLGKDATLTGRTLIWPYVIDAISEKPLLGWGFNAFWSSLNPVASLIDEAIKGPDNWFLIQVPEAHNGILEMLLEIGFVGTSLFIIVWVRNFVMATKCMNGPARQIGLSSVLLLIGILVVGVSEGILLGAQQTWTILFFMMGFMCEKEIWRARAARRQGMTMTAAGRRMAAPGRLGFSKGPAWH